MTDPSFSLVLPHLQTTNTDTLWVADENALGAAQALTARNQLQCITNRYDIYKEMRVARLSASYSDYDFSAIDDDSLDCLVYRVSKERAVVHHVINNALRMLRPEGKLVLVGEKTDGIKGYADKAGKLFGIKTPARKSGLFYTASVSKKVRFETEKSEGRLLDDKNYTSLRPVGTLTANGEPLEIYSKPGQFGWNKQDQGSKLLIKVAERLFDNTDFPDSVLDLGCGYGYLSLSTKNWNTFVRVATDNNAAAIVSCQQSFLSAKMDVSVTADDCGANIEDVFDCILCNPPFHQGFNNDSELTKKFLKNAARLTKKSGVALFVVNQFISLETLAKPYFSTVKVVETDGQFKVVALSHDR